MAPQTKRRKVESAIEEINFDPTARHDYLTGFHKRKVQRVKLAQEYAQKKAREEKVEERKKIREQRAAEIKQAIDESRKLLKLARDSDSSSESASDEDEWGGFEEPAPVDYEEEYIDEDKYTTVTVEEMGVSRTELQRTEEKDEASDDQSNHKEKEKKKDDTAAKAARKQNNPKKRKKKFRYESKEDRKASQKKQRLGRQKKASARRER